jgi:VWFA-related protein
VDGVLPKIQKLGTMMQNMVAGEAGEVAVLAFDHRLQRMQEFTSDPNKIDAALKKIKPGSSTSRLTDAIEEASRMLRTRPKERRRVILLISETRDHGSEGRIRETLTTTQVDNVMIYSLNMSKMFNQFASAPRYPRPDPIPATARNVPGGGPQTPDTAIQITGGQGYGANFVPVFVGIFKSVKEIFVDNPVEVFTKFTGGRDIPFLSQKSLETAAAEIGREIHNQYLITYNPNNKMEGGFHNIRVTVKRRGLDVRTRPGYWLAAMQ